MREIKNEEAERIARSIGIPPRPSIVSALAAERAKDSPDLRRMGQLIAADVGLSAAVLKTVNSPLYGLNRTISSVREAINLLGLNNVGQLVTSLLLRASMPGGGAPSMDRFWDTATHVAAIAAFLAARLPGISAEQAYTYGLFCDCGIPLLMQKHPNYKDTLGRANATANGLFTDAEDAAHATNHAVVGHFLARSWFLPAPICQAILCHHDPSVFTDSSAGPEVCTLIAMGHLADTIAHGYLRSEDKLEWGRMGPYVLGHLGLTREEYGELEADALAALERARSSAR